MRNQAENQFTLAARITSVDQANHIFALDQFVQHLQARLGFRNRVQVKVGWQHGQVGKTPFAALHFKLVGRLDFHQMANGRRQHVLVAFKVIVVFGETTDGARNVGGHGGFFRDDQFFGVFATQLVQLVGVCNFKALCAEV